MLAQQVYTFKLRCDLAHPLLVVKGSREIGILESLFDKQFCDGVDHDMGTFHALRFIVDSVDVRTANTNYSESVSYKIDRRGRRLDFSELP